MLFAWMFLLRKPMEYFKHFKLMNISCLKSLIKVQMNLKSSKYKVSYVLSKKDSNHLVVFQQPYLMALLLPEKVGLIKREGTAWCRLVFPRQWTLAKWKHREGRWPRPAPSHVNENDRAASAVWQEEGRVTQCRKVAAEYWVLKDPDEGIQKKPKVLPETLHLPCVKQTNSH